MEIKIADEELKNIIVVTVEREVKQLFHGDYGVAISLRDSVKSAIRDTVKTAMKDETIQQQIFDGIVTRIEATVKKEMLAKMLEKLLEEKEGWSSQ